MISDLGTEKSPISGLEPLVQVLLNSLASFQDLAAKLGAQVQTHSDRSLQKFLSLEHSSQTKIVKNFTAYLSFLTKAELKGFDLKNDRLLLLTFLKEMGFIFDKDVSNYITEGDVIEVYTSDQTQVYRNLAFMELCNYTLLDLLSFEPYELYERSAVINGYMFEAVGNIASRPFDVSPVDVSFIPCHVIREKFSQQKLSSIMNFKTLHPLYTWPNEFSGFVVTMSGQNIQEPEAELSFL